MMTELSFWEKYRFKSFMFLHYKGLELNSSFIPSSPDCWCRWQRGFRKPAVVDQRVGFFLEGSSGCELGSENDIAVRFNNAGSLLRRTCKGMSVRNRETNEWQKVKASTAVAHFKDLDYIMRASSSVSYWFEAWMVVTSISLWGRYGWKADSGVEVDGSPEKSSGDWVPVELALVPSPPTWGSCSSNTATNCREKQRQKEVLHLREWNCNRMVLCPEVSVTTF